MGSHITQIVPHLVGSGRSPDFGKEDPDADGDSIANFRPPAIFWKFGRVGNGAQALKKPSAIWLRKRFPSQTKRTVGECVLLQKRMLT
ncbi:MAG: hypothetical protein HY678_01510 [Chloroflexi bacterium]|nr:hypothetical protein [Chloroflexota bacterium]